MYTFSRLSSAAVRHTHFISFLLVTPILWVKRTDYEAHPQTYTFSFLQPIVSSCKLTSCIIIVIIIIIIIIINHPQSSYFLTVLL